MNPLELSKTTVLIPLRGGWRPIAPDRLKSRKLAWTPGCPKLIQNNEEGTLWSPKKHPLGTPSDVLNTEDGTLWNPQNHLVGTPSDALNTEERTHWSSPKPLF